jgi:hypothetical protein
MNEIFSKASEKERLELMKKVCAELAGQHEKGIVQKDLHLGNFLLSGETIVVLDPAEMRFSNRPVGRRKSTTQLALLTSNISETEGVREIWGEYFNRRGWQLEEPDEQMLEAKTEAYKRRGLKKGLKKSLRTSKRFIRIKTGNFVAVFAREFYAQEKPTDINKRIEELMTYKGKEIVVERYGHKGFFDSLLQTIMGSRARQEWLAGYRVMMLGIPAPKPLAYIEQRKWGLVWESYLARGQIEFKGRRTIV